MGYTYDNNTGRIESETLSLYTDDPAPLTYTTGYAYNGIGQLTRTIYPDGSIVDRDITKRGQLETVSYASDGNPASLEDIADIAYDNAGRETARTLGTGPAATTTTRSYDRDDNLVTGIECHGVVDFGYAYDQNKNPIAQTDEISPAHSSIAGYDNNDRLTSFDKNTYNQHDQVWALSNVGDWDSTTLNGVTETRDHNDVHEIMTSTISPNPLDTLVHDAKGNLTDNPKRGSNGQAYLWDQDNMMSSVDTNGNGSSNAKYHYDGLGRRVAKFRYDSDVDNWPILLSVFDYGCLEQKNRWLECGRL